MNALLTANLAVSFETNRLDRGILHQSRCESNTSEIGQVIARQVNQLDRVALGESLGKYACVFISKIAVRKRNCLEVGAESDLGECGRRDGYVLELENL